MAPITATSVGIPRQTIDDPKLINLLTNLSKFDVISNTSAKDGINVDGTASGNAEGGNVDTGNKDEDGDITMSNAEQGTEDSGAAPSSSSTSTTQKHNEPRPPLDINGLVQELSAFPKWQFQEQADLYEWIHPLNAIDATINYFINEYPSLLLPTSNSSTTNGDTNKTLDLHQQEEVPTLVIKQLSTILIFLSQLLKNAINKSIFNSVSELSLLLSSSNDEIVSLAINVLCSLSIPPMLHRQSCPELGGHVTALHRASRQGFGGGRWQPGSSTTSNGDGEGEGREECNVMWKLISLSKGWGSKGSGLGLLDCITLNDVDLMVDNNSAADGDGNDGEGSEGEGNEDKENKQQIKALQKCAGEISFECYVQPKKKNGSSGAEGEGDSSTKKSSGHLVTLYIPKEEMFIQSTSTSSTQQMSTTSSPTTNNDEESSSDQQAEKRRRIGSLSPKKTTFPQIKSTSQLYYECLAKISTQLGVTEDATSILSSEQLYTLLSSIRLARSFHTSNTRISGVEDRLRALTCMIHSYTSSENVGAYFIAQPELVGELVDLLRPTVSSGNISSGVVLSMENDDNDGEEEKKTDGVGEGVTTLSTNAAAGQQQNTSILALSDSPIVPYSIRTLAIEALTALVARRDASTGSVSSLSRQTNVLAELGVGKGQYLGLLPTLIRYSLAALNSFLLHDNNNSSPSDGRIKMSITDSGKKEKSVKDIGLELGLAFLKATKAPPLPQSEREERALEFIDSVLTLTSSVISVPSGTASLTDCGIIPALVSTIALDGQMARRSITDDTKSTFCTSTGSKSASYSDCLMKFISAQAIQILEGAIVTHNSALSAFHELKGVDILVQRLHVEVEKVKRQAGVVESSSASSAAAADASGASEGVTDMAVDEDDTPTDTTSSKPRHPRTLQAARRTLLFSAVNCLTVVFHQHEVGANNPATTPPSGGAMLRKPELHDVLLEIMDNVDSYGAVLAALVATFITDAMNSDPQSVHYVHKSGLAKSFMSLLMDEKPTKDEKKPPTEDAKEKKGMTTEDKKLMVKLVYNSSMSSKSELVTELLAAHPSIASSRGSAMQELNEVVERKENPNASGFVWVVKDSIIEKLGLTKDELEDKLPNPILEPSPELIMALPNVIMALSLTEAGAKVVAEANPFPAMMSVFCNPKYVMPNSRCLLNEMAAILGTGLDECMRHNPSLKTKCLKAVVQTMKRVVTMGQELMAEEDAAAVTQATKDLETARTCLIQYGYNIVQLLEQVVHSEDHVSSFVSAGGFDALLDLAKYSIMAGGRAQVANVTCLSTPSISTVQSSISKTLSLLTRTVCSNTTDPSKLIKKIIKRLDSQLIEHGDCIKDFTKKDDGTLVCDDILENIPTLALPNLEDTDDNRQLIQSLSKLFRGFDHLDWLTSSLASILRAACQRANELGLSREREWKKEISSKSFEGIMSRLSLLHRSSLYEVCRIRTQPGFDERDEVQSKAPEQPLVYKIRIVCQEGAIIRNGIDIDRCENVGNMEMGEVVCAYDRCINSSGVLRYHTSRGWVSELTRGGGRENIAEVLDVSVLTGTPPIMIGSSSSEVGIKRVELGVSDLQSASASVLARLQKGSTALLQCFSMLQTSGIRTTSPRLTFQNNTVAPHVIAVSKLLSSNIRANLEYDPSKKDESETGDESMDDDNTDKKVSSLAKCMYLGSQLNALQAALYDEKRDEHRSVFNLPLLINLFAADGWKDGILPVSIDGSENQDSDNDDGGVIMSAIRFVLLEGLRDMADFAAKDKVDIQEEGTDSSTQHNKAQRMSRAVAASSPPTLSLLRRLVSRPLLVGSQMATTLTKMKPEDFASLITTLPETDDDQAPKFNAAQFTRSINMKLAKLSFQDVFSDDKFSCVPSHVLFPWMQYLTDVIGSLEEASKVVEPAPSTTTSSTTERPTIGSLLAGGRAGQDGGRLLNPAALNNLNLIQQLVGRGLGGAAGGPEEEEEIFEPSEESINQLAEMGFSREHATEALEMSGTNRVEIAMEYALTHPPSSPATLERRRAAREQRRQQQQNRRNEMAALEETASNINAAAVEAAERELSGDTNVDDTSDNKAKEDSDDSPKDKEEDSKPKPLSEEEIKAKKEKEIEEKSAAEAMKLLQTMKDTLISTCLNIIESSDTSNVVPTNSEEITTKQDVVNDPSSCVIIMANFLLGVSKSYPDLESNIATKLLERLKGKVDVKSPSHCRVKSGSEEASFASLCHTSVVIFRARPNLRPMILRQGLIGIITHCIRAVTLTSALRGNGKGASASPESAMAWPTWLTPALLLLEVMAHPTSATTLEDDAPANKKSEYGKLLAEHKKISTSQEKAMKNVYSLVTNNKGDSKATPKKSKKAGESKKKKQADKKSSDSEAPATEGESKEKAEVDPKTNPPPIPPLHAMMRTETQEACMLLCLQLLGLKSKPKKGGIDKAHLERVCPPPAVVNAILVLLVRLLRSRKLASLCLQMGGADLILALPDRSYFPGNRDIVSLALRRMLEDEVTLHSMMETEIRSIITKVYKKQHPGSSAISPKVNLKSFMTACTPLICRDSVIFFKAIVSSVKIESTGSASSSLASSRGTQVTLLSNEERAKNSKILAAHFAKNATIEVAITAVSTTSDKPNSQDEAQPRRRSKSPHRSSISKSPGKSSLPVKSTINGTPANHIATLLLRDIMRGTDLIQSSTADEKRPFLSTLDYLDTLSDLVLAVPACGAAIHRYKPTGSSTKFHHAISGCPDPPQTAVSFILHKLLPQPRETSGSNATDSDKALKLQAYNKTKLSQAGARLIVCLVARSGEGRRRVIADLVFALSSCGQSLPVQKDSDDDNTDMWAISTWSDLCFGLSSPRTSTPSPTGQDSSSNLSFGVLKMLLEAGAPHALMCAMERINLHNPMSSSVATSVIRPLEILSRSTVYSTVSDMAEKEKAKMEAKQTTTGKDSRRSTFGPTERSESVLYDAGLEDDFNNPPDESMDDTNSDIDTEDDESMEEDDSESEIEVRLGNVDYSDEEDDNSTNESEDDEEISSDEDDDDDGSSSGSSVESDDIDNESDGEEESMDNSDEEEVDMFPEADEDDELAAEENLFFDAENEANLEGMPGFPPGMEGVDGEWAMVPPNGGRAGAAAAALGLGGMPGMPPAGLLEALGLGGPRGRAPGGGGEDAEAMLGNIVRGDSIGLRQLQEQLANLEQLAGQQNIRVVRGNRASGGGLGGLGVSSIIGSPPVPELESVNVHQRTFGSNSRSLLLSPMESVFGVQATRTSRQGLGGDGREEQDEIPSLYDTQLFPGGISASTRSRAQPTVHPLLQSVSLAPSNSIYQLENQPDQSHNSTGGLRARSFITGANGNLIQVHDRFHDGADPSRRGGRQGAHSGWTDDGIQPDRSTEDFSVAFGSALNDMMDRADAAAQQASLAEQNNDNSGVDDSNGQDNEAENDEAEEAEAENDEVMNEAEDDPAEDQAETENAADSNEPVQPPPAQEQPSEDAAVSSAMADGLTIDSGASNEQSVNNETNNDDSTSNDAVMEDGQAAEEETAPAPDEQQAAENNESSEEANQNQEEVSGQDSNAADTNVDGNQDQQAMETDDAAPAEAPEDPSVEEVVNNAQAPTNEESNEAPSEEAANNEGANNEASAASGETNNGTSGELTCPPDIDPEVFASLPLEMQQEVVEQHQQAQQISESGLDPEALAALPEDMRREVIAQEQNEQRQREQQAAQPAADPANAEEMDNASFLASLTPDLRQEILLTADDTFIQSLPPNIIAEANVLRERVNAQHRQAQEAAAQPRNAAGGGGGGAARRGGGVPRLAQPDPASRRRQRNGKLRIEADRDKVVYTPSDGAAGPLLTAESSKAFISLLYLLSPVQPQRIIHNFARNLCLCEQSRSFLLHTLVGLLNNDNPRVLQLIKSLDKDNKDDATDPTSSLVTFPPTSLIGVPPVPIQDRNPHSRHPMFRRRPVSSTAVTITASLPSSSRGSSHSDSIPPVVARRVVGLLAVLCKSSARVSYSMLLCNTSEDDDTCMEKLLDLLQTSQYSQSASNLEQLLNLIDIAVAPMALLTKEGQEVDISADRPSQGKVWVKVPRVVVSKKRLHSLVNTLRLESCVDASFLKINNVMRRLCRVEANKLNVLNELALVAEGLGKAAILDMKAVSVRLRSAAKHHKEKAAQETDSDKSMQVPNPSSYDGDFAGTPSSAVSLSTSNSELKLLRVLQMLNALCSQDEDKGEGLSAEFSSLLKGLNLEALWDQLNICLNTVSVLEGVANIDVDENDDADGDDGEENETNEGAAAANGGKKPKLQNSVAGLITRFLPAIEAFFMINASPSPASDDSESASTDNSRLVEFAASNKILLNALLRSNPSLLEKGLRAMVKMPKCRVFLDFDVKRAWFKTQVRRLRQQASRRYGSVRLNLRRKHVFDDSFHAFVHRNAEELRGRLQITFAEEEGVDAGGLSREFFAILAKEMFNPNYALFMSTEDGCTFQPNPNSTINPDDKRYFKFVGRIVGKAVSDGFLLDAHFTRSLYKHMLGVKPTHHDMQAIDPDYYKNLQMILEHKLEDIGLDLTFSTEDHAFGRSKTIDLIPDGHKVPVTEESKAKYVDLVCQYRMTTAIEKQIKAFLEGFHEMVDIDLISIFTAKELELLISGMPDIDIQDLKKNTDYNGYRPADKLIGWFWNVMFNLSKTEKAAFLQFVTGSSKVPLAGFSELQGMRGVQKFSINKAGGGDTGAIMSAHTCFNALDLPEYKSEEEMKEKLLLAISEGAGGFGFA